MTTSYKILGQTAPSSSTETLNYTVPSNTSTLVRSINITNTSSIADTYYIAIVATAGNAAGNANYIAYQNTISGNSTITIKSGYTLPTGSGIRVKSTNGTTTFSTFGAEIQ